MFPWIARRLRDFFLDIFGLMAVTKMAFAIIGKHRRLSKKPVKGHTHLPAFQQGKTEFRGDPNLCNKLQAR